MDDEITIDDLINLLNTFKERHGNIKVAIFTVNNSYPHPVNELHIENDELGNNIVVIGD